MKRNQDLTDHRESVFILDKYRTPDGNLILPDETAARLRHDLPSDFRYKDLQIHVEFEENQPDFDWCMRKYFD